jgi:hypothetical protein
MRQGILFALVIALAGVFGCSKNDAATSQCNASADTTSCESCCHANGANGYSYAGSGSCSCLGGKASAGSTSAPSTGGTPSFAGTYRSNWGATVFTQTGSQVTAKYPRGSMTCAASGSALDCDWREGSMAGKAHLVKEPNGSIDGTWGNGSSATNGGPWVFNP